MIKKLKIKFVVLIMLLLTIVMVSIMTGLYAYQKNELSDQSLQAMNNAVKNNARNDLYYKIFGYKVDEMYPYFNIFVLDVETYQDKITKITAIGYDENLDADKKQYLIDLVKAVPHEDDASGILQKENLRYLVDSTPKGMKIAYLDKNYEDATLSGFIKNSLLVTSGSLLCFLIISLVMTKIATDPVAESFAKQKQLVADMSHELKTPITVISANADIVLSHKESTVDDQKKWIEYIKQEADRMTKLINQLLFLAKNDEKSHSEPMTSFDFSDAAESCVLPFESVCFERHIEFITEIQPGIYIYGGASTVKQLIMILLDNAAKYAGANGHIIVSLKTDGDKAVLKVNNSGDAIPADRLEHIFERFYRVDEARTRSRGGCGLGLSIAKSIVDSHNGKITVKSDEENGTTFTCIFKKVKKPAPPLNESTTM